MKIVLFSDVKTFFNLSDCEGDDMKNMRQKLEEDMIVSGLVTKALM